MSERERDRETEKERGNEREREKEREITSFNLSILTTYIGSDGFICGFPSYGNCT